MNKDNGLKAQQQAAATEFEGIDIGTGYDLTWDGVELKRFKDFNDVTETACMEAAKRIEIVHLVGGKILAASDLEAMNRVEVIARKHKFCTIRCADGALFLAKNRYNESENAWEPSEVMVNDEWVNIDVFDDEIGFSYSCEDYRQKWQRTKLNE